jgi:hypothetical protein
MRGLGEVNYHSKTTKKRLELETKWPLAEKLKLVV